MKFFEEKNRKIYFGDVIEVLNQIENESIDLIFADPPYNIGKDFNGRKDKWENDNSYLEWCYEWLSLCLQKLKPSGSIYVMTATQFMPYFDIFLRDKIDILSRIIWYNDGSSVQAKKYFGSTYEPILYGVKNKKNYTFNAKDVMVETNTGAKRKLIDYRKAIPTPYNTEKVPSNVWEFSRVRYRMEEYECHPTQKPISLLERIIKASSNEGDTVLDPFAGTFTTNYVAYNLNRKTIGIEIEEEYVKIGLRRLNMLTEYNGIPLVKEEKNMKIKNKKSNLELTKKGTDNLNEQRPLFY